MQKNALKVFGLGSLKKVPRIGVGPPPPSLLWTKSEYEQIYYAGRLSLDPVVCSPQFIL